MENYYNMPKKPSGCLAVAGWFMLSASILMVAFGVFFWVYDDKEWTRKQDMEGKKMEEWERNNEAYENVVLRLDSLSGDALLRGDRSAVRVYADSLREFALGKEFATEVDSIEFVRLDSLLAVSLRRGSVDDTMNYCDSLREQALVMAPDMPDMKYLGFPLGGLVSVFVFILAVPPFLLGVILLIVYYSKRSTYRCCLRNSVPPPPPPASI